MIGHKFGFLTIWSEYRRDDRRTPRWLVICDCGAHKDVCSRSVRRGRTTSCGCAQRRSATRHALSGHPLYARWKAMIARCRDPKAVSYPNYGGRGIDVCADWSGLPDAFIAWGDSHGLNAGTQIDRIDNDGDYCPSNCRVVARKQNARNTRGNRLITVEGRTMTLVDAAERYGQPYDRLRQRIVKLGWSPDRAVQA